MTNSRKQKDEAWKVGPRLLGFTCGDERFGAQWAECVPVSRPGWKRGAASRAKPTHRVSLPDSKEDVPSGHCSLKLGSIFSP